MATPLTAELLTKAMTSPRWAGPDIDPADAQRYLPYIIEYCNKYAINTRDRLSAFLAQTGTESGSFKWWREFSRGEGKPFGNWYGRGPMQLTWEENYQAFQDATGHRAHDNPEIVADDATVGFESAGWFWRSRGLNDLADQATWPSFYAITGRVWGQSGPFHERDARYDHAWSTLPSDLDLAAANGDDGDQRQTNFDKGIEYLWPAVGKVRYWFWPPNLDIVPDGAGAYAVNDAAPPIGEVINAPEGMFCQAVVNLIRRVNRKKVPTMGDNRYDGGTWAKQNFWAPWSHQFSRNAVYPRGTLIGRRFVRAGDPGASAVVDQGHVAVLLGEQNLAQQKDPLILQSHPDVGGLATTPLSASHSGWFYQYAIRPEDWINHDLGGF